MTLVLKKAVMVTVKNVKMKDANAASNNVRAVVLTNLVLVNANFLAVINLDLNVVINHALNAVTNHVLSAAINLSLNAVINRVLNVVINPNLNAAATNPGLNVNVTKIHVTIAVNA